MPIATGGSVVVSGNKYRFSNKSNKKMTISQSGGRNIKIEKMMENSRNASRQINDTISSVDNISNLYSRQNELFYQNNNFVDIDNLNQKNELLIEMMNILNVYNWLIAERSRSHGKFFTELDDKINQSNKI